MNNKTIEQYEDEVKELEEEYKTIKRKLKSKKGIIYKLKAEQFQNKVDNNMLSWEEILYASDDMVDIQINYQSKKLEELGFDYYISCFGKPTVVPETNQTLILISSYSIYNDQDVKKVVESIKFIIQYLKPIYVENLNKEYIIIQTHSIFNPPADTERRYYIIIDNNTFQIARENNVWKGYKNLNILTKPADLNDLRIAFNIGYRYIGRNET